MKTFSTPLLLAGFSLTIALGATETPPLPPGIVEEKQREEATKRHIFRPGTVFIAAPPPPLRAESKPPPPAPDLVWKPGHWAAVKGEWKWTPGEWAVPPLASSVWIEGKYSPETQRWSPGYWQPDRPPAPDETSPAKPGSPTAAKSY